jgi:hypothetical protein
MDERKAEEERQRVILTACSDRWPEVVTLLSS